MSFTANDPEQLIKRTCIRRKIRRWLRIGIKMVYLNIELLFFSVRAVPETQYWEAILP